MRLIEAPDLTSKQSDKLKVDTKDLANALSIIGKAVSETDIAKKGITLELTAIRKDIAKLKHSLEQVTQTDLKTVDTVGKLSEEQQSLIAMFSKLDDKVKEIDNRVIGVPPTVSVPIQNDKLKEDIDWLTEEIDKLNKKVLAEVSKVRWTTSGGGISVAEAITAVKADSQIVDLIDGGETTLHSHAGGAGDMTKAVYDPNNDGVIAAAQLDPTMATDAEVSTAVSDHAGAADPHTGYQKESEKGAASGYASLNVSTKVVEQPASISDFLEASPTNGVATKAPDSNWAFDHNANVSAHHTKYTDAEAVAAVNAAGFTPAENYGFTLDAALSADGKWSGIVEAGTAGAILAFGDLVYYAVADSKWELADADLAATAFGKLGICVLAAAENAATVILLYGKVNAATAFPDLTIGAPVHVGLTAGDVQVAAPTATGDIVRIVGYGNTIDELFFCPDNTYLELV